LRSLRNALSLCQQHKSFQNVCGNSACATRAKDIFATRR
jgi:hypothetical protein